MSNQTSNQMSNQASKQTKLLFVCTGNTCRSPMAAALAQTEIAERGLDWQVESAGIYASDGMAMSPLARQALTRRHIVLAPHKSKAIRPEMIAESDKILAMTRHHADDIIRQFPEAKGKVEVLGAYLEASGTHVFDGCDIVDPFGQSDDVYEAVAEQIHEAVRRMIDGLVQKDGQASTGP